MNETAKKQYELFAVYTFQRCLADASRVPNNFEVSLTHPTARLNTVYLSTGVHHDNNSTTPSVDMFFDDERLLVSIHTPTKFLLGHPRPIRRYSPQSRARATAGLASLRRTATRFARE
jgi:hypothetical protein